MQNLITLEELLIAKEGEDLQFKEAKNHISIGEVAKCCCALANGEGGMLVLGITDTRPREVVGCHALKQPERIRKELIDKLKVNVDFCILGDEENPVLVFEVVKRPLGSPVLYEGIAWWYEGDSLIPMPENIRRKIYDENGMDYSATICKGATLNDLDEEAIEDFRRRWIEKSGNKRIASCTNEQSLRDCGVITEEGITYAALILFGRKESLSKYLPQSEVIFEYHSTEASGPANQRVNFREGFFLYYDQLWNLINLRNDKQHYQEGFFVYDIPTFNERVIREAILNAISHRNYQMPGSVFIRQYPDHLVVESPGGLPIGISLDNILDRQSSRNRLIVELLEKCGLVERSGQGMNLIYELSIKEAKELPDFTGTDDYFVKISLSGLVLDKNMLTVINKIGEEKWESLSTSDFLVINNLYHEKELNENLRKRVPRLIDMGLVEHIGRNKYVLSSSLYAAAGKSGVHTRIVGLDRDTNKELIVKHITANGEKGTPLREIQQVLPGKSHGQIQELMHELSQEERIHCLGKGRGAKWFLGSQNDG